MLIKSNMAAMLQVLKDDISDDEEDGYIYDKAMFKKLTFHKDPMEIRLIDVVGKGFYALNITGESVENVFGGLMALHCNYSINFDYFSKVMRTISDIATNSYAIKKPLKKIDLTHLNWQDAYIRYNRGDNPSHQHTFNINGAHTIFNDKRIVYDIDPTMINSPSSFNGCIGYFDADGREGCYSGFVMRMQCSFGSVANYEFYVSLDEDHPVIIMDNGQVLTYDSFKFYIEQHLYKILYRNFLSSGVWHGSLNELKSFTPTEMKDLVKLQEMIKV